MSLRLKILCMFLLLALFCVVGQRTFAARPVERAFAAVERELGEQQITRVQEAVAAEQRTLARLTRIDAVWSEPYKMLESGDRAGISSVYPPLDLLRNYDITEALLVDVDGAFFAGGPTDATAFDPTASRVAAASSSFVGSDDASSCGLWQLDQVSLYCTHPVLRTDGSGPPLGWLTFFQPVDDALLERLSEQLQLPLAVGSDAVTPTDVVSPADAVTPGDAAVVAESITALDDATLRLAAGFEVDNSETPLVIVSETERPVTQLAARTERDLLVVVLACVGLFVVATVVMAETFVLRRVVRVTRLTGEVRASGDLGLRLPTRGRDELSKLASSVNDMLDSLDHHRDQATSASQSRQAAETSLADARRVVSDASRDVLDQLDAVVEGTETLRSGASAISDAAITASGLTSQAQTAVQQTQSLVAQLATSTEAIDEVAGFIASVAEETNLLALNATIEAARAGDLGRGFAVVAEQVKELALKTSESTASIGADVKAMRDRMAAIESSIDSIATLSADIDQAANSIAESAGSQRQVTEHVASIVINSRQGIGTLDVQPR